MQSLHKDAALHAPPSTRGQPLLAPAVAIIGYGTHEKVRAHLTRRDGHATASSLLGRVLGLAQPLERLYAGCGLMSLLAQLLSMWCVGRGAERSGDDPNLSSRVTPIPLGRLKLGARATRTPRECVHRSRSLLCPPDLTQRRVCLCSVHVSSRLLLRCNRAGGMRGTAGRQTPQSQRDCGAHLAHLLQQATAQAHVRSASRPNPLLAYSSPTPTHRTALRREEEGDAAGDAEPEQLVCDAAERLQCAFSCGQCSNTPLCTVEGSQALLDSKLHSGPATGEDTGEEGYVGESEGVEAAGKRIALCVTGAKEDEWVDAYAIRSIIDCLLPSLRRDRTDLFVMASSGWRNVEVCSLSPLVGRTEEERRGRPLEAMHVGATQSDAHNQRKQHPLTKPRPSPPHQAERIAVAVDRRADPTLFEITNVLRQMSPEVHQTWENQDLPPTWTKKGEPNMRGHSLGRLWLQVAPLPPCSQHLRWCCLPLAESRSECCRDTMCGALCARLLLGVGLVRVGY
jgi:hypothetical protein